MEFFIGKNYSKSFDGSKELNTEVYSTSRFWHLCSYYAKIKRVGAGLFTFTGRPIGAPGITILIYAGYKRFSFSFRYISTV